jgi:hypothetical protein
VFLIGIPSCLTRRGTTFALIKGNEENLVSKVGILFFTDLNVSGSYNVCGEKSLRPRSVRPLSDVVGIRVNQKLIS